MSVVLLSLLASVASAADLDGDGCEDSYFTANSACVSPLATMGSGTTIGASTDVGAYAALGADIALGANATVSARSTVIGRVSASGARPIGDGTIIARGATIGADQSIGADNIIGRSVDAGERLQTQNDVTIGYAAELGDDVTMGANVTLGTLVHVGNNTTVAPSTVMARGVDIADSPSSATIAGVIGPEVTIGAGADIDSTARIRKSADLGANVTVMAGARIGRDVQIGDGATIGANVRLAAGVTVTANTLVPEDTIVQQGDIYDNPQTTGCVAPWLPTQGQSGLSDGIGTNTRWSIAGLSNSYNGAVLSHNFTGEFEVIASWNTLHMGVGLVHGSTVDFQDINGYSTNNGSYWANITLTGFPNGYAGTYKGYYNAGQLSHVRWLRQGTTVSIQSATGPSGPWSHITGSPYSVPSADTVVVGLGEGSGTNPAGFLQLVSCTEN